jgi:hypothetical protein
MIKKTNKIQFVIDAKTVVKWFCRTALIAVSIQTFLMYINVLPTYDYYVIILLLVLVCFGRFLK